MNLWMVYIILAIWRSLTKEGDNVLCIFAKQCNSEVDEIYTLKSGNSIAATIYENE